MKGTRSVKTTTRIEWELPTPCVWADVEAVFSCISQELAGQKIYDDTVRLDVGDDRIIVSYEPVSS